MAGKLERRSDEWQTGLISTHACQSLAAANLVGQFGAVFLVEQRFVIPQIQLRRCTGLEQKDHTFGFRCVMQRRQDATRLGCQHLSRHHRPETETTVLQQRSPRKFRVHRFTIAASKLRSVPTTTVIAATGIAEVCDAALLDSFESSVFETTRAESPTSSNFVALAGSPAK